MLTFSRHPIRGTGYLNIGILIYVNRLTCGLICIHEYDCLGLFQTVGHSSRATLTKDNINNASWAGSSIEHATILNSLDWPDGCS